jgi:hypothetical protein
MALSKGATPIRIIDHPNPRTVIWRHFGFVPLDDCGIVIVNFVFIHSTQMKSLLGLPGY